MTEPSVLQLSPERQLAYHRVSGKLPGVPFCGGYTSDMTGTKALALEALCRKQGRAFVRFDYAGHGASSGDFADGTIGAWAGDAVAIVDRVTEGPLLVVGSSMGGWIMLLVALVRPERVSGLIGIAAAPDFTEDLLLARATAKQRRALAEQGYWMQPSDYGRPPYPVMRRASILCRAARSRSPAQSTCCTASATRTCRGALRLAERLQAEDVTVELIKFVYLPDAYEPTVVLWGPATAILSLGRLLRESTASRARFA